ncbi:MAG: hypothetical protein F6K09_04865 [Merismopedia sp. SIO2A8]|nr:hypothetical protein [Symploca sp. SIO2B6]NET48055.1 hypothetical protein [Merismopedia sp. SIO2A8]
MSKRGGLRKRLANMAAKSSGKRPEEKIQELLDKEKYSQAINAFHSLNEEEQAALSLTEASIWLQRGQYECEQSLFVNAEESLTQALRLNSDSETLYWLSKAIARQGKYAELLTLLQTAFDDKTLDKPHAGAYLKALFLNDKEDVVQEILKSSSKSKRFYANHLHWARGMLSLQSDAFDDALAHFKKITNKVTPGGYQSVWTAYAHQQAGNWSQAAPMVVNPSQIKSSPFPGVKLITGSLPSHPAKQRLAIQQAIATHLAMSEVIDLEQVNPTEQNTVRVLEFVHLLEDGNYHDAAHIFEALPKSTKDEYPEIGTLFRPLMLLAGEQASNEGELGYAASFWQQILEVPQFDPKLALRLHPILSEIEEDRDAQKLLNRLIKWVQQEAKKTPNEWPSDRLNSVLAKLHCYLFDSYMVAGQEHDKSRALKTAIKLAPEHPDVLGRQGLEAALHHKSTEAVDCLTRSLEAGCDNPLIYRVLVDTFRDEGDTDTVKQIRRKYGGRFSDVNADNEVDMPVWLEALLFRNYALMEDFIEESSSNDPAVEAIKIFLQSAEDDPSSSHKITLGQAAAIPEWDKLLNDQSPEAQVPILQAISLVVHHHTRRNKKGMKALQEKYHQKLADLSSTVPAASIAYAAMAVIRAGKSTQYKKVVADSLKRSPQPSHALAMIQQQARWFDAGTALTSVIDEYLQKDPQHPQLLLAKATTYPAKSAKYQQYYDQGFDLARRLQDADALQLFREEEWFQANNSTSRLFKGMGGFGDLGGLIPRALLEQFIREQFGEDIPKPLLEMMVRELEAKFAEEFGGGGGSFGGGPFGSPFETYYVDEDEEDDFFFLPPPTGKDKKKKKKKWFDL